MFGKRKLENDIKILKEAIKSVRECHYNFEEKVDKRSEESDNTGTEICKDIIALKKESMINRFLHSGIGKVFDADLRGNFFITCYSFGSVSKKNSRDVAERLHIYFSAGEKISINSYRSDDYNINDKKIPWEELLQKKYLELKPEV